MGSPKLSEEQAMQMMEFALKAIRPEPGAVEEQLDEFVFTNEDLLRAYKVMQQNRFTAN